MSQKKKHDGINQKTLVIIDDPKAAVLDYRQLKITIQNSSSHHLPTPKEIKQVFTKYGNCEVESIGKSNQYLIKYKTPNAGFMAQQSKTNGIMQTNNQWCISSIKFQWNNYCPSIFHSNSSQLSICSKGSKCTQMHTKLRSDCAFIPSSKNNKAVDNLSWEKLREVRRKLYKEYDTVEDIEDWNNMEGITMNNGPIIHNHKKKKHIEYSSTSSSDSDNNNSSTSSENDNNNQMNARKSPSSHKKALAKKKKALAQKLLKNQIKNGNANRKLEQVVHKKKNIKPKYNNNNNNNNNNRRRVRKSPPLSPLSPMVDNSDNKSVKSNRSAHSNRSNISYRSARSTVYVNKPNINNDTSSDSDSSSFDSDHDTCNKNKKINLKNDWNKLNDDLSSIGSGSTHNNNNNKGKNDTISMRYLSHKRGGGSGGGGGRSKRKSGRGGNNNNNNISNSKVLVIPKGDNKARGSVRNSNKDIKEEKKIVNVNVNNNKQKNNVKKDNNNNKENIGCDASSITSAEKIALQTAKNVLGSNSNLSRVPIIDPNKRTVKYGNVKYVGNNNNNIVQAQTRKPPPPSPIPSPINNYNNQNNYNQNNNIMRHPLSSMPNTMISPMNGLNINPMNTNIVNAPPYYPSAIPSVFNSMPNQPPASVPNFMNSMSIAPITGTGNILAGTFKAAIPQAQQPFVSQIYNTSPMNTSPMNTSPIVQSNNNNNVRNNNNSNYNMNNNTGNNVSNNNNNNNNNNNANDIPSIPTTSVSRNDYGKQHKHRPSKPKPKPKPLVSDLDDAKFDFSHDTSRSAPSTIEDYHWLCYHFRSGISDSCIYGKECKWRHYDFRDKYRCDIITQWNPKHVNPRDKPRVPQLSEASILKTSIESQYKWLKDRQDSNNIFINNNNTPPDMKKQRIQNHKRNNDKQPIKKKLFMDDGDENLKINEENKEQEMYNDNNHINIENVESENDNDNDMDNGNENRVKENILRDLDTSLSIMAPFSSEQVEVNYHLIGNLAYQQLIALRKMIAEEL